MPSTVSDLLEEVSLRPAGVVLWSQLPVPNRNAGVYIVSLSRDCNRNERVLETAPIDHKAVSRWISRVPKMELDGRKPSPDTLAKRLGEFWLPDESILYIGKSGSRKTSKKRSLEKRTKEYHKHVLGDPKPHRGGHWIKTLSILSETFVHYAESSYPKETESRLIKAFIPRVSSSSRKRLGDAERPFPFANLEFPKGTRKRHGISRQAIRKSSVAARE